MLCNSLIQPYFHFPCCARYPNLSMSLWNKLRTAENACKRFCLGMERRSHIGLNHFEKINWLPVKNRVDQSIAVTDYNFKNNLSHVKYIYAKLLSGSTRSVDSFAEAVFMKEISRKSITYLGSKIWNGLDKNIQTSTSTSSFKHALKNNS